MGGGTRKQNPAFLDIFGYLWILFELPMSSCCPNEVDQVTCTADGSVEIKAGNCRSLAPQSFCESVKLIRSLCPIDPIV